MNVKEYLERINIKTIQQPSYSFLAQLQLKHMMAVPFENLDIRQGLKIVLDERRFYEKIVRRRRGGFCYELNGLFQRLLAELGFAVSIVSGRVYNASKDRFGPEFDHIVLVVHLGKTFVVDVGFGDGFRKPLALPDGSVQDVSGNYRIKPPDPGQDVYLLQRMDENDWQPLYSFTLQSRKLSDFSEMCEFNQTSPSTFFTQETFCSLATEKGRVTLSDDALTITEGDNQKKVAVTSPEQFEQLLVEIFEISLDAHLKPL